MEGQSHNDNDVGNNNRVNVAGKDKIWRDNPILA